MPDAEIGWNLLGSEQLKGKGSRYRYGSTLVYGLIEGCRLRVSGALGREVAAYTCEEEIHTARNRRVKSRRRELSLRVGFQRFRGSCN